MSYSQLCGFVTWASLREEYFAKNISRKAAKNREAAKSEMQSQSARKFCSSFFPCSVITDSG